MKNSLRSTPLPIFILGISLIFGSCSTTKREGDTYFEDVKYYHLDSTNPVVTQDPMVQFEQQHLLYGAISAEERRARDGHYYVFVWTSEDRVTPAEILLEYRQKNTGSETFRVSTNVTEIKRKNVTKIAVTGEPYVQNGTVTAWRVSIIRNGSVVATEQSYLWK